MPEHDLELQYKDCTEAFDTVQILSDGTVRPCCWCIDDVGNLYSDSLENIWDNEKFNQLRKDIKENKQFNKLCVNEEKNFVSPCIYVQNSINKKDNGNE